MFSPNNPHPNPLYGGGGDFSGKVAGLLVKRFTAHTSVFFSPGYTYPDAPPNL